MENGMDGWTETSITLKSVDIRGNPLELKGVRAYIGPKTGKVLVMPNDVTKAELATWAEKLCIEHRDIATLIMLYAKPSIFQEGYVHLLYRMNKMLFYQWKKLDEVGFGEALPHDGFEAIEKGPRPKNLKDDLRRLERQGFIKVDWPTGNKKKPAAIHLTSEGMGIAEAIWNRTPPIIKEISLQEKTELFLMDPRTLMEKVHAEYPEWKFELPDDE